MRVFKIHTDQPVSAGRLLVTAQGAIGLNVEHDRDDVGIIREPGRPRSAALPDVINDVIARLSTGTDGDPTHTGPGQG